MKEAVAEPGVRHRGPPQMNLKGGSPDNQDVNAGNLADHPDGRTFTIAPSDLTFLLGECRACFYLKIAHRIRRPSTPFPSVFTIFDRRQREFFAGKSVGTIAPNAGRGVLRTRGLSVRSQPIRLPHHDSSIVIRGAMDVLVDFDDGTAGIIDLKTTDPKDGNIGRYALQLHAYALAVESPEAPALGREVTLLGLACFQPGEMRQLPSGELAYLTTATWMNVARDDRGFLAVLDLVLGLLEHPEVPAAAEGCPWCRRSSEPTARRSA